MAKVIDFVAAKAAREQRQQQKAAREEERLRAEMKRLMQRIVMLSMGQEHA